MRYRPALFLLLSLIAATALAAGTGPALLPLPQKMECREGAFQLQPKTRIVADSASKETGQYLAERLRSATGFKPAVKSGTSEIAGAGAIVLTTADANAALGPEGYDLTVGPDSVVIRASGQAGMFYGVQTLLQLLPPEACSAKPTPGVEWKIPCVQIQDQPRFKWRGFMFDVSRHFFTKAEVKELLDVTGVAEDQHAPPAPDR